MPQQVLPVLCRPLAYFCGQSLQDSITSPWFHSSNHHLGFQVATSASEEGVVIKVTALANNILSQDILETRNSCDTPNSRSFYLEQEPVFNSVSQEAPS